VRQKLSKEMYKDEFAKVFLTDIMKRKKKKEDEEGQL